MFYWIFKAISLIFGNVVADIIANKIVGKKK